MDKRIRDLLVRAEEEMIFLGPDHPTYSLLAGLVASVRDAWQEGYDHARRGGSAENPYRS
jgi:hypothetical protein